MYKTDFCVVEVPAVASGSGWGLAMESGDGGRGREAARGLWAPVGCHQAEALVIYHLAYVLALV